MLQIISERPVEVKLADQALKEHNSSLSASWLMRGLKADGPKPVEIESMSPSPALQARDIADPSASAGPSRDWSSALDLIREASEAISISEERAADLETRLQQVTANAGEEARQLNAKIAAAERRAQKAEERARSAEARASEAETWLVRIHDAILNGFSPKLRSDARQQASIEPDAAAEVSVL